MLYCGTENQPSTYLSLCLSDFLSFHTFNNFVKAFWETMQARAVTFDMQTVDFCVVLAFSCIFSPYLFNFLSLNSLYKNAVYIAIMYLLIFLSFFLILFIRLYFKETDLSGILNILYTC